MGTNYIAPLHKDVERRSIEPIPGSRKLERLRENFEAGSILLTPEEVARIDAKLDTMNFAVFGGHSAK